MITTPTVLVLGAGASCDCLFPMGRQLLNTVVNGCSDTGKLFFRDLENCGFHKRHILDFGGALNKSGLPTIDAFLEHRAEDFLEIGKAAIALVLIPYENEGSFSRHDEKNPRLWYEHLWERLGAGTLPEEFCENRLSVVTFNYDRSLEHFLTTAASNSYGLPISEAADLVLSAIGIVHVHGQLGEYSPTALDPRSNQETQTKRAYVVEKGPEAIAIAARGVRIIHEASVLDPSLARARELVSSHGGSQSKVCFLGFGFHPTNVGRLTIDRHFATERNQVYASAMGLGNAERANIVEMVGPQLVLGKSDDACLAFLLDKITLWP